MNDKRDAPGAPARIAAVLGVIDEVELIADAIANLRNIGVQYIVVADVGSTDGTSDVLSAYRGDSDILVHSGPKGGSDRFDNIDIFTPTFLALRETFRPDLVLLLDADEFWIPASGQIANTSKLADAGGLLVPRYNMPVVRDRGADVKAILGRRDDEVFLISKPVGDGRAVLDKDPGARWIMTSVQPKVLFKADQAVGIAMGGHGLTRQGEAPRQHSPGDLVIAHAPFTSRERFMRKVRNIQQVLGAGSHLFSGGQAWHWKRWAKILEEGDIEAEYERQCLSEEEFKTYLESGVIQALRDYFDEKRSAEPAEA